MKRPTNNFLNFLPVSWSEVILSALTVTFGLQTIRALLPYLQYLLSDRLGFEAFHLGLIALTIFGTAFLTGWFNRWLGLRRMLLLSAGGLGLTRLAMQVWTGDPLGDMFLAMAGTVFFVWFWPVYLGSIQGEIEERAKAAGRLAEGILLGIILDLALHGLFLTYDFIWQQGIIPLLLTVVLVAGQGGILVTILPTIPAKTTEGRFWATFSWLAVGPFLFLQILIFQNLARLTVLTGWPFPLVFGWGLASHLVGLWTVERWQVRRMVDVLVLAFLLLSALLRPIDRLNPFMIATLILTGQAALAVSLATILHGMTSDRSKTSLKWTTVIHAIGMILLVVFIFGYYIGYSLAVPFQNTGLFALAGIIILTGVGISTRYAESTAPPPALALKLALPLLLLPLLVFFTWRALIPATPAPNSVRVMTYNVHNGFDTKGHLGLEALAQTIEAQQPDIVALQEVSRGWAINGSVDMATWLSQRLEMPYVFAPSADQLWGQAVLSRYPILSAKTYPLPPRNLPLKRSFAHLQIDVGQDQPLPFINTHYHHRTADSAIRVGQTEVILDFLAGYEGDHFIITGDLNAEPDTPEIRAFLAAGAVDVVLEAGLKPDHTYPAEVPDQRLDYILIHPPLASTEVVIPPSTASDHLGIAATISLEER